MNYFINYIYRYLEMPRKSKIIVEPEIVKDLVSKLITDMDGVKVVKSDKFPELIMELFAGDMVNDLDKFKSDEFGNQPIMLVDEKLYKMNLDKFKVGVGLNRKSDDSISKMTPEEKEIYFSTIKLNAKTQQKKYRDTNRQKYNDYQRKLYHKLKTEGSKGVEEATQWINDRNLKAKEANKKYREKKKAEKIAVGEGVRSRGRPRKVIE